MIFVEAARAFDPGLTNVQPTTRLDTFLLGSSALPSVADAFLNGTAPDRLPSLSNSLLWGFRRMGGPYCRPVRG